MVDDDADVRETIAEHLTTLGVEVLQAANGVEALFLLKRARPGGIVLDLTMPRVGGLEALKHIKRFDPTITVVVVTGGASATLAARAREQGAVAVLRKPVSLEELTQALNAVLVKAPALEPATRAMGRLAADPGEPRRAHILIVDDDPVTRATLEEFFRATGYNTRVAADGEVALQAIKEEQPDIILLDFTMPNLSGLEALSAIRTAAPETKVIMVSGLEDADQARQTIAYGASDFVVKPVNLNYLAQSVETALLWNGLGPS